jgi:hypothetical protein
MAQESLARSACDLAERGFSHSFRAISGRLKDLQTGQLYDPEQLRVAAILRFEGDSDPDEQAALLALETGEGRALGTYSVVYGPGTPAEDAAVLERLGPRI